jgi:phosphatidylglycerol:prolipoprotein diacylglycerol transferase
MFPELFRIGGFVVTTFGLMMLLSFLSAAWLLSIQLERFGQRKEIAWDVLAGVAIAGIAGAKAYYLALHPQDVMANPIGEIFSRGGLVWYGGLIGGVLAYYFQVRAKRLPVPLMFDATAPALAVAYAVGRMGCFLVGDDYGAYTDSRVGIAFPKGSPPSTAGYLRYLGEDVPAHIPDAQVVTVHPTQLYEIALALIMFAILWRLAKRPLRQGQLFASWMILYAVLRFGIEFVRAKGDRIALGMSTSQVASIALLAIGVTLWTLRRNAPPLPAEPPPPGTSTGPRGAQARRHG